MAGFKRGHDARGDLNADEWNFVRRLGVTTLEEILEALAGIHAGFGSYPMPVNQVDLELLSARLRTHLGRPARTIASVISAGSSVAAQREASERRFASRPSRRSAAEKQTAEGEPQVSVGFDPADTSPRLATAQTGALPPQAVLLSVEGTLLPPEEAEVGEAAPGGQVVIDLREQFQGVRQQGTRGTCVAHACAAVLEHHWQVTHGQVVDFSPQFEYWQCKERDGSPGVAGTLVHVGLQVVEEAGVCREPTWPYNPVPAPGNEGQGPPPGHPAEVDEAMSFAGTPVRILTPPNSAEIRKCLDERHPVALSVAVHPNWWGQVPWLYGQIPMPLPGSKPESGHAICVVGYGYDPDFAGGGFFVVRNSWGTEWAIESDFGAGYGTLPFAYVDQHGWEAGTIG